MLSLKENRESLTSVTLPLTASPMQGKIAIKEVSSLPLRKVFCMYWIKLIYRIIIIKGKGFFLKK